MSLKDKFWPAPQKKDGSFPIGEERVFCSQDLFGEAREIKIEHDGAYYRLLITKSGKLILNK